MRSIFPRANTRNIVITTTGVGARTPFSVFITDSIPDMHTLDSGQCFPLRIYTSKEETGDQTLLASETAPAYADGITDSALERFRQAYFGSHLEKEDVFYYVYGLLHSPDYRARFADNLSKELPRIPCVKTEDHFWAFSKAGRELATLHLNYERAELYPVRIEISEGTGALSSEDYRVRKMKFASKGDKSAVIYNERITIRGIPLEAYEYVVNGRPAIESVMERQVLSEDSDSGIVNDPNRWAIETVNNPRYPLELFQRIITVSLETLKIVKGLPALDI
jgi:predicted helicase